VAEAREMSGKDELIFSKEALLRTHAGKDIIKARMLQSKGYKQFNHYKEKTEQEFPSFVQRFTLSLHIPPVQYTNSPKRSIHRNLSSPTVVCQISKRDYQTLIFLQKESGAY
jgi:hypothetical protein